MTKPLNVSVTNRMKFLLLTLLLPVTLYAQAPGVAIVDQSQPGLKKEEQSISDQVERLMEEGKMLSLDQTKASLKTPTSASFDLPPRNTVHLSPPEIVEVVRKSSFQVGWGYLCENCDHWHVALAGGYAVSNDGVIATCAHVIDTDGMKIRKGGLIAVDQAGKVFPVQAILANHDQMDAAFVKIDCQSTPLPLNDQIRPGDLAFCLSRPLGQRDYFSQGLVNRFYWDSHQRGGDDSSLQALGHLKLNVSSRWAQGSSGSPVVDSFGNAIGHVALIHPLAKGSPADLKGKAKGNQTTMITLHTATPARALMALARSMP